MTTKRPRLPRRTATSAGYAEYLHGQVRELLTGYGQVDYLFFDFSYPGRSWGGKGRDDWRSQELMDLVRSLQPDAVVNDRSGPRHGDVVTPEQYQPTGLMADGGPAVGSMPDAQRQLGI